MKQAFQASCPSFDFFPIPPPSVRPSVSQTHSLPSPLHAGSPWPNPLVSLSTSCLCFTSLLARTPCSSLRHVLETLLPRTCSVLKTASILKRNVLQIQAFKTKTNKSSQPLTINLTKKTSKVLLQGTKCKHVLI